MAQTAASTSKGIVNKSTCPGASPKPPQARSAVAEASPPTGVLLDFNDDVEFVQLPPSVLANMETAQTYDLETKEKEHSAAISQLWGSRSGWTVMIFTRPFPTRSMLPQLS